MTSPRLRVCAGCGSGDIHHAHDHRAECAECEGTTVVYPHDPNAVPQFFPARKIRAVVRAESSVRDAFDDAEVSR